MTTKTLVWTSGSTITIPSDYNASANDWYAIGAGGNVTGSNKGGGGGGAFAHSSNLAFSAGATPAIQIGTNGGSTGSGTTPTANTWLKDATTLLAAGGTTSGGTSGGAGGSTANSFGNVATFAGGNGGSTASKPGGGGGAAGPNGAGNAGTNGSGGSAGAGGSGDAGSGGAAGSTGSTGGAGGDGSEWTATAGGNYGSGGGGGAGSFSGGGVGGNYGGGAGGGNASQSGTGGLLVLVYTPATTTAYTLTSIEGTYALTGEASITLLKRGFLAVQGAYTLTGKTVGFIAARLISAVQGAYTLTGKTVAAGAKRPVAPVHGSYVLTGEAATTLLKRGFLAVQGAYTLTGKTIGFKAARIISALPGFYSVAASLNQQNPDFSLWSKSNATTASGIADPNGGSTAYSLTNNSTNSYHIAYTSVSITSGQLYEFSAYMKYVSDQYVEFIVDNGIANGFVSVFDLVNGAVGGNIINGAGTFFDASIQAVGNGWYYCTIRGFLNLSDSTVRTSIVMLPNSTAAWYPSYVGSGSTVNIWEPLLAQSNTSLGAKRPVSPVHGAYNLTGYTINTHAVLHFIIVHGAYTLTGITQNIIKARQILAAHGSYVLTGFATVFHAAFHMAVVKGSYIITGFFPGGNIKMPTMTGFYDVVGLAVTLLPPFLSHAVLRSKKYVLQQIRKAKGALYK